MLLRILQLVGYFTHSGAHRFPSRVQIQAKCFQSMAVKLQFRSTNSHFGIPAARKMRRANNKNRVLQYSLSQFIEQQKDTARFATVFKKKIITMESDNLGLCCRPHLRIVLLESDTRSYCTPRKQNFLPF